MSCPEPRYLGDGGESSAQYYGEGLAGLGYRTDEERAAFMDYQGTFWL
jgi:hypothetical protein